MGSCPAVKCWGWGLTRVNGWGPSSACKGLSAFAGSVFRAGLSFLVWTSPCHGQLTCTPARSEPAGTGDLAWGKSLAVCCTTGPTIFLSHLPDCAMAVEVQAPHRLCLHLQSTMQQLKTLQCPKQSQQPNSLQSFRH